MYNIDRLTYRDGNNIIYIEYFDTNTSIPQLVETQRLVSW